MPNLPLTKSLKIYNGEKIASSTTVGKSGYPSTKKLNLDPCLSPYTSINSKWIKYLNIRPDTLELIQERVGNTLEVKERYKKGLLNRTSAAQESMNKWDFIKLKIFCTQNKWSLN
jgi:hypothetical protein